MDFFPFLFVSDTKPEKMGIHGRIREIDAECLAWKIERVLVFDIIWR